MTEPIYERVLRDIEHLFHHQPHPSATIAASSPKEAPVSVLADIKAGLADLTAKLETIDADALDAFNDIKGNPEAAAVLDVLGSVAKAELPAGLITAATSGLSVLTKLAETHAASAQPAAAAPADAPADPGTPEAAEAVSAPQGPVVAGVA